MRIDLPAELAALGQLVDAQPANVRELFQWSLAMLMVEQYKAQIVEQHIADEREYYTFASIAGDVFSLVKPSVSGALLEQMIQTVREIVSEDVDGSEEAS